MIAKAFGTCAIVALVYLAITVIIVVGLALLVHWAYPHISVPQAFVFLFIMFWVVGLVTSALRGAGRK